MPARLRAVLIWSLCLVALWSWAGVALAATDAATMNPTAGLPATEDQTAPAVRVMPLPTMAGYPLESTLPLCFLVQLPPGYALAGPAAQSLSVQWTANPGFKVHGFYLPKLDPSLMGKGQLVVAAYLTLDPAAPAGLHTLAGGLVFQAEGGGQPAELRADFAFPLEVLPKGQPASFVSPEMMARLGVPQDPPADAGAGADDPFASQSTWWRLILIFVGGLALNLTPCIYPMIPLTVSLFGGQGGGGAWGRALAYWAGLAVMYSVLGSFVALSGAMLGTYLGHPVVLLVIAVVLLAMAASMFGLWEIRMPQSLNRLAAANRSGMAGAFVMGLLLGIIAAPCVGPFVVALMTHVAQVGDVFYGWLTFLVLALGMGLPLAVLAAFSGLIQRLPGAGDWMIWVRRLFGFVLILMAVHVMLPVLGNTLWLWMLTLVTALGGFYLGFMEPNGKKGFRMFKKIFGLAVMAGAVLFFATGGGAWWPWSMPSVTDHELAWEPYTQAAVDKAVGEDLPVMVDFSAEWCSPCRQMEATTFKDPEVVELMKQFQLLRADVTGTPTPDVRSVARQWQVRGVPTLAFLDKKGNYLPQYTMVGYLPAPELRDHLKKLLAELK